MRERAPVRVDCSPRRARWAASSAEGPQETPTTSATVGTPFRIASGPKLCQRHERGNSGQGERQFSGFILGDFEGDGVAVVVENRDQLIVLIENIGLDRPCRVSANHVPLAALGGVEIRAPSRILEPLAPALLQQPVPGRSNGVGQRLAIVGVAVEGNSSDPRPHVIKNDRARGIRVAGIFELGVNHPGHARRRSVRGFRRHHHILPDLTHSNSGHRMRSPGRGVRNGMATSPSRRRSDGQVSVLVLGLVA